MSVVLVSGCSSPEERAQSYFENGMKLLAANDYARAGVELRNAVRLKKNMLPAWQALARIEEHNRHWQGLIPILRTVVELAPNDLNAKLELARTLILTGSLDEALTLVDAANEIDGKNADVDALKALLLFKLNDAAGAIREAQASLAIDPRNGGAMIVLAAERLGRGDAKGALEILDSDPVARAKDLGLQLFKLKVFEKTQDLPQIESVLRKLIELYPDELEFRRQLIRLYAFEKRPEEAEKEQRAIVAAHPADLKERLDLVRLLLAVKGPAAARQELVSQIDAGGDVFPYQIALAEFDFAQGNLPQSVQLLERLIKEAGSPEQVVTAQVTLAQMYLSRKNVAPAEALVADVLRKDGRNNAGLRLRAAIRMDRGEVEPAIGDLRQALNDQPRSPELMLLLASAYERAGSIELAEKEFADAMRAANFDPRVGLAYVAFLQRRGSTARAEDVVTELASRWPKNIELLSALAQIRLVRQNWIGAQEVAEAIRRIGNDRGIGDQLLAAALTGRNKFEESIGALENAYAAAPTAVQPMVALVRAFVRAKKTDRAVGFLQSVLKANPDNAEAYVLLGSIALMNNAPDQAVKNFTTAIEKQPKNPLGYRALAELYVSQHKDDEALKIVRAGLTAEPENSVLRLYLAGILEREGNYDGAIAEYETMLEKEPGSLLVINNLASLLADHHAGDKASLARAQSLATALRKSPVPQFKDTLGWVTYLQGDYTTAVPLLEEAAKTLTNRGVVHYHLGMSYLAAGEPGKASEQLKLALSENPDAELKAKIEAALKKAGT